jgi:O-antigen/teichoic acid export membrane protein
MLISTLKTNTVSRNIVLSATLKAFNILFVILIVRRSLDVLGVENYGIWTAIASISTWISLLDVGVGNGLRVELRRCFIDHNWREAKMLLNTAYIFIGTLSLVVLAAFAIGWFYVDWAAFFNVKSYAVQNLNYLILVTIVGLVLQLFFSLLQPVLNANLHSGLEGIFPTISNGLIFCYLLASDANSINLMQYAVFSATLPVLGAALFSFFYYSRYVPQIIPNFRETDFEKIKPILLVSGKFFFLQISSVLTYQMTSFLLIRYFTPTEVAEYNVAFRYFNLFYIVFMTALSPLWSMSTDAYLRGDLAWIEKMVKKYLLFLIVMYAGLIVGYFMRDFVFKIWLGDVTVSPKIAFYVALYMAVLAWNMIFLYVVTGAGKIQLQFVLALVTMIIYFPLTHFLVKILNLGIDGIFIGNTLTLFFHSIFIPIQTYYLLKTDKKGIWTKE